MAKIRAILVYGTSFFGFFRAFGLILADHEAGWEFAYIAIGGVRSGSFERVLILDW